MGFKNIFTKSDHREQYEYARARLRKRKALMRHFILFLSGSILFLIMDLLLKFGRESLPLNWSSYLILFWFFILLVHCLNVLLINKFMDKEWEDRQIEKLKSRQIERILKLQKRIDKEYPIKDDNLDTHLETSNQNTEVAQKLEEETGEEEDNEHHSRFQP